MNPTQTTVATVLAHSSGVRINGESISTTDRRQLISPIDGTEIARVGYGSDESADAALASAEHALPRWSATPAKERSAALRAIADDLSAAAAEGTPDRGWAWLISTETGKLIAEAAAELNLSATYCRVFADLLDGQTEESFDIVPGVQHRVEAHPVGTVAVLTPWNFPVSIPMRKLAPALAAGCTAVFKPSELAPLSSMVLAELMDRHLPAGTVNTVLGDPDQVATPWLDDPRVHALTFTGSTRVGRLVAAAAAQRFLPSVLELGGCAPFIVLDDADLDHAADTLMIGKFRNNGQSCIAANQVFVPKRLVKDFTERLAARANALTLGDPRDSTTSLGPLAPAADPARISSLVAAAVSAGGRSLLEPSAVPEAGHFVAPQFVTDVPVDSDLFAAEVFGPVAGIHAYTDLDAVVALHRDTGYGLAGYVCGTDLDRMRELSTRLRAGIIGFNTATPNYPGAPFGGVGLSGLSYEGGRQGLEAFQSYRTIAEVTPK